MNIPIQLTVYEAHLLLKAEEDEVLVNNIPMILGMSLIWPTIIIIWALFNVFEKWGDKKIL